MRDVTRTKWAVGAMVAVVVALVVACTPPPPPPVEATTPVGDDGVRLNEVQFLGTHNSYIQAPSFNLLATLQAAAGFFPQLAESGVIATELAYSHRPLPAQLASGLRSFDFDVFADSTGGRFTEPIAAVLFGEPYPAGVSDPGMKVLNIQDFNYGTTCPTLISCLTQLKAFSDANPDHLPITINLELKEDFLPIPFGLTQIQPFDDTQLTALEDEISSVLGDRLITPDDVRGTAPDVATAVTTTGWPTVADTRGRFLLFIGNTSGDVQDRYLALRPNLEGAKLFTSGDGGAGGLLGQPGYPVVYPQAVLTVDNPGNGSQIQSLVEQGYLVRTRADANVLSPSTGRRDVALASGAQVVHTDFPKGEALFGFIYSTEFPTRVQARCNPVLTVASGCEPEALVEPQP